jgi:hypothetical protein
MIQHIKYFRGTGRKGDSCRPKNLTIAVSVDASILANRVQQSFERENIDALAGEHGDETAGDPVEIDWFEIETEDKALSVTVFNRGLALLLEDDEKIRRLHRFLCVLEEELAGPI